MSGKEPLPFSRNSLERIYDSNFLDFFNMFDDFFNESFFSSRKRTFKIDIKENEKEYLIEAELPGNKKNEIKLDYKDDKLLIIVKREEQINNEKENYIQRERRLTSMQREVYLKNVIANKIDAKLEDGVLKVVAPKNGKPENQIQIEVK